MILYDALIQQLRESIAGATRLPQGSQWPDGGSNQMIFRQDSACELGGGTQAALGGTLLTSDPELVEEGVFLLGPDIPALSGNVPYARIAVIQIREEAMGTGNALHQSIRKTEYTRYHVSPEGFQPGISARAKRETARVSRKAQQDGLTFGGVGKLFQDAYRKHPWVEKVQILFITEPQFPYGKLGTLLDQSENITKALDHLLQKVKMDCNACHLKEICAEVEQLCAADSAQIADAVASRYE